MTRYTIHPLVRMHITEDKKLQIIHAGTKKEYLLDTHIAEYISFFANIVRSKPTKAEIIQIAETNISDDKNVFNHLAQMKIIIDSNDSVLNEYNDPWLAHNWEDFYFFLKSTENNEYVDDVPDMHKRESVREKLYTKFLSEETGIPAENKTQGKSIALPDISTYGSDIEKKTYFEAVLERRTIRDFSSTPMTLEQLSYTLFHSCHALKKRREYVSRNISDNLWLFTHSHSLWFGITLVIHNVVGLEDGLYTYDYMSHTLTQVRKHTYTYDAIQEVVIGQNFMRNAAISLFITVDFQNIFWRYRYSGSYKTIYITMGELAQKIIITANMLGLGVFETPALIDERQDEMLNTEPFEREAVYYLALGNYEYTI